MDNYIARQPIFNRYQEVIAYELLFRDSTINAFNTNITAAKATSTVLVNSFLNFGMSLLTDDKYAFINFDESLILEDIPLLLPQKRVIIEILESVPPTSQIVNKLKYLKSQGYLLALDDYTIDSDNQELFELADIIKVDFLQNSPSSLPELRNKLKAADKIMLAEKIEHKNMFIEALSLDYEMFQGYFFSHPILMQRKKLDPSFFTYCNILEELGKVEPNYNIIASLIETDAPLTFQILKLVNSSYSLIQDVVSIKHALSIIGINPFKKWFSLALLYRFADYNKPDELVKTGIFRMCFLDKLGTLLPKYHKHLPQLNLIAVLSVLEAMLEQPLSLLLEELPISPEIKETLMGKDTIYSDFLKLVLYYEKGEFKDASQFAVNLQILPNQLPTIYLESIKYSESIFRLMRDTQPTD